MKTPNKTKRLTRILTSAVLDALRIACQLATALFIGQPSKQAEMPVAAFQQLSWLELLRRWELHGRPTPCSRAIGEETTGLQMAASRP